ncbi:MAG TPA: 4-alpha-glucanotransferase [Gemmataceae bacterium]|nr:4-alpha-glucanotransferase [Gemmataceae bacterium]
MSEPQKKLRPTRTAGLLLHPTSFPGRFGIGDLGPAAYAWIDTLVQAKQSWWQILPLGPTAYGDSPYQCYSAFAGNPNLVSPEFLVRDGLLKESELAGPQFTPGRVDYPAALAFKNALLDRAWANFQGGAAPMLRGPFEQFNQHEGGWLFDFAFFMALKKAQSGKSLDQWQKAYRLHDPAALTSARKELATDIGRQQFAQFLFYRQWDGVRGYARECGIKIIGDAPIFVSGDSVDVWMNPQLFLLDAERRPKVVAGVPPDYFNSTGQLWGNPVYDWEAVRKQDYAWWVARLRRNFAQVDLVRLDHFRGFAAAWHVPAGEKTAINGKWVPGPGADLFRKFQAEFHGLPLIAEDLGLITEDVEELRKQFNLPGMRVLQFAFSDPQNKYLPHNFDEMNTAVYTGTHDNDTTRGWFATIPEKERDLVRRYLARDGHDIAWDLIRAAWSSVADLAIAPLQDVLNLSSEARMNMPGQPAGNWGWRVPEGAVTDAVIGRLAEMTELYGRAP